MKENKVAFSLRQKMHMFIMFTVLLAVFGTAVISYYNNLRQIDRYYKSVTISSARNFTMMLDAEFLKELKAVVLTDEYTAIRDQAEADDNEAPIEEYIRNAGLWDKYTETCDALNTFLDSTENIKYLYIVVLGDENATKDMFLFDDDEMPIYKTGYYEDREDELMGINSKGEVEPTISNGEWGWLCSAFAPVYDDNGEIVCHVGCDVSMDAVMQDRHKFLLDILFGALILTSIAVFLAASLADKMIVKPLRSLTTQMKEFKPSGDMKYEDAGVVHLNLYSQDEIQDLYQGIRQMQIEIIDYLNHVSVLQKYKERAESDIKAKDDQISQISQEAYKDGLTDVGNKSAYNKAVEEINEKIVAGDAEFAIVMVDVNDLKLINDEYGHESGDEYIKGCSQIVCDVFSHSPVFRIGGDEFVAILQGNDYAQREYKMNLIEQIFERSYAKTEVAKWLRFSAAAGIAEKTLEDANFESVFKRADEAMYKAKKEFKEKNGSYR